MTRLFVPSGEFSLSRPVAQAAGASAVPVAVGKAAQAALGNNVKSVRHSERETTRLRGFALKDAAAKILQNQKDKLGKLAVRVSHCRRVSRSELVTLDRAGDRAKFDGLKTCSSVWCCAVCSARISAGRREELNVLLSGARSEGLAVVMLTLTASHKRGMNLAAWLEGFKEARRKMKRHRRWASVKSAFVGGVVATEVTYSDHADFHPHFHDIMVFDCSEAEALEKVESLREAWSASLAAQGLSCNANGFQVQPASAAGDYIAKFGAAEAVEVKRAKGLASEMTSSQTKQGRNGGLTPWQLLEIAEDKTDPRSRRYAAVWLEYAAAFLGRRQLVWSPGLKARFGIGEVEDDQIPDADPANPVEVLRAWAGKSPEWKAARRRYVALLRAAEAGSDLDRAEFGPSDKERWQASVFGSVIDQGENRHSGGV